MPVWLILIASGAADNVSPSKPVVLIRSLTEEHAQ
jgi:hypothetical protein